MEFRSYEEKIDKISLDDCLSDIKKYIPNQLFDALQPCYNINDVLKFVTKKFGILSVCAIDQGKVHYVYKCLGKDNKSYILKIRSNHFRTNKNINILPSSIEEEYNAYKVIQSKIDNLVPDVIEYNKKYNYILTSYLPYNSIEDIIHTMDTKKMENIAIQLSGFHKKFSNCYVRDIKDENITYKNLLYYRYGILKDDRIFSLIKEMYEKRNSLIHGDITPENIFINPKTNTISFIDLESVHFGNSEFDVGFFLAHILIQNLNNPSLHDMILTFLNTYISNNQSNINLIYKNIGATILYRINSGFKYYDEENLGKLNYIANYLLDNDITSCDSFSILCG